MRSYRISAAAEEDIIELLAYSERQFGERARKRYEAVLLTAIRDIASDPERLGSINRPELGQAVRSYHLRHSRGRAGVALGEVHRPRHLLLYRLHRPETIGIGRVLHDAMDFERHVPSEYGDE
jgi:toxin ParE1/3/4